MNYAILKIINKSCLLSQWIRQWLLCNHAFSIIVTAEKPNSRFHGRAVFSQLDRLHRKMCNGVKNHGIRDFSRNSMHLVLKFLDFHLSSFMHILPLAVRYTIARSLNWQQWRLHDLKLCILCIVWFLWQLKTTLLHCWQTSYITAARAREIYVPFLKFSLWIFREIGRFLKPADEIAHFHHSQFVPKVSHKCTLTNAFHQLASEIVMMQ